MNSNYTNKTKAFQEQLEAQNKLRQYNTEKNNLQARYEDFKKRWQGNTNLYNKTQNSAEILPTIADGAYRIAKGDVKAVEGIVDFALMLGSDFDRFFTAGKGHKEFQDKIAEMIKYNVTEDIFKDVDTKLIPNYDENIRQKSALNNDSQLAQFGGQVLEGVGNMLPTIALTAATGGGNIAGQLGSNGLATLGKEGAGQLLNLGVFGAQATGQSMEEALQYGADYDKAELYATISGLVEMGTEMLGDGVGGIASGMTSGLTSKLMNRVATNSAMRFGLSILGEGGEEVVSEFVSPFLDKIYKEAEDQTQFMSKEHWENMANSFLLGMATSAVLSGGSFALTPKGARLMENIDAYEEAYMSETNPVLKERYLKKISDLYFDLSSEFTRVGERLEKRGNVEKATNLKSQASEARASAKIAKINEAGLSVSNAIKNTTKEKNAEKIQKNITDSEFSLKKTLQSYSEMQRQEAVNSLKIADIYDAQKNDFIDAYKNADIETKKSIYKTNEIKNAINKNSNNKYVITYINDPSANYRGANETLLGIDGLYEITINTAYANDGAFQEGIKGIYAHETTHTIEKSKTYKELYNSILKLIKADSKTYREKYDQTFEKYKNSDYTKKKLKKMSGAEKERYINQELVADYVAEHMFTDEEFIAKICNEQQSLAKKILSKIKSFIKSLGETKLERQLRKDLEKAKDMYIEALKEGSVENKEEYSITKFQKKSLKEQINLFEKGEMPNYEKFYLGKTPDVLINAGAKNYKLVMSQSVYNKITSEHHLSKESIMNLYDEMKNPLFVLKGSVENSLVEILSLKDYRGREILVSLAIKSKERDLSVTSISSAYGKKGLDSYLKNHIDDIIGVANKEKTAQWLKDRGLQLPKLTTNELLSTNTIASNKKDVNRVEDKNLKFSLTDNNEFDLDEKQQAEFDKMVDELLTVEDLLPDEELEELLKNSDITKDEGKEILREELKEMPRTGKDFVEMLNMSLSDNVRKFFKDSVVKSNEPVGWFTGNKNDKYIIPMYHGTPASDMYFFDEWKVGTNGTQRGVGFYLTDNYEYAQAYNGDGKGKIIVAFVNITKPLSDTKITISKDDLRKFVKAIDPENKGYARYDYAKKYPFYDQNFLDNYGSMEDIGYEAVLDNCINNLLKYNKNDVDIINELYYLNRKLYFSEFFDTLKDTLGYDGVLFKNRAEGTIVVAFNSNQIKDINNQNPTTNKDIRYSLVDNKEISNITVRDTKKNKLPVGNKPLLQFDRDVINNKDFYDFAQEAQKELQTYNKRLEEGKNVNPSKRHKEQKPNSKYDFWLSNDNFNTVMEIAERSREASTLEEQKLLHKFITDFGGYKNVVEHNGVTVRIVKNEALPQYAKRIKQSIKNLGNNIEFFTGNSYKMGVGAWYVGGTLYCPLYNSSGFTGNSIYTLINHENYHNMCDNRNPQIRAIAVDIMRQVRNYLLASGDYNQALDSMKPAYPSLRKDPFNATKYTVDEWLRNGSRQNSLLEEFVAEFLGNDVETNDKKLIAFRKRLLKKYADLYLFEDVLETNVARNTPRQINTTPQVNSNAPTNQKVKVTTQTKANTKKEVAKDTLIKAQIATTNYMAGVENTYVEMGKSRREAEILSSRARAGKAQADSALENGIYNEKGEKVSLSWEEIFGNARIKKESGWDPNVSKNETAEYKRDRFEYLLHQHNVDRQNIIPNEVTFTEAMANIDIDSLSDEDFIDVIYPFLSKNSQNALKKGTLTLEELRAKYGKYIVKGPRAIEDIKASLHAKPELYKLIEKAIKQKKSVFGRYLYFDNLGTTRVDDIYNYFPTLASLENSGNRVVSEADVKDAIYKDSIEALKSGDRTRIKNVQDKANDILGQLVEISPADSQKKIAEMEAEHPEFKQFGEDVWEYNRALLDKQVEFGILKPEVAEQLKRTYPHYVPTYRDTKSTPNISGQEAAFGSNGFNISKVVKTAIGSDLIIEPLDVMIARQTRQTYTAGALNYVANQIYQAYTNGGSALTKDVSLVSEKQRKTKVEKIDYNDEKTFPEVDKTTNTITFYNKEKGTTVRRQIQVSDNVMAGFEALHSNYNAVDSVVLKPVRWINNTFKKLVTNWSPFFVVRNFFRDLQDAIFYTRYGFKNFIVNLPKAYAAIMNEKSKYHKYWLEYQANGGKYGSIFNRDYGTDINKPKSVNQAKFERSFGRPFIAAANAFEKANMIVEQATRLNEYILARENGASVEEAIHDAQEITVDFGRTGTLTRTLNSTLMPFLNPNVQGTSKAYRAGKEAISRLVHEKDAKMFINLLIRAILLGMIPALLNGLIYDDDDDYASLPQYYKDQYYLFKVGDNNFIKIPKGRVLSIFGSTAQRTYNAAQGEENAFKGYKDTLTTAMSPVNNFRTIFSPIKDVQTNTTWYGGVIESSHYDAIKPSSRYDEDTSWIAKKMGKVLNYSPLKIDYLLDQYSGVVGDIILPATSDNTLNSPASYIKNEWVIDSTYKNAYSGKFYSLKEEETWAKNEGDAVAELKVRYLNKVNSAVSELIKQQDEIKNNDKLSKAEKNAQLKLNQIIVNNTYKAALNGASKFEANLRKFKITESNKDTVYYDALYMTFGGETALKFYNSKLHEKSTYYNDYLGINYDTIYATYIHLKSLSATKEEAFAYINQLKGLNKNQKQLLYRLCGYTLNKSQKTDLNNYLSKSVKDKNAYKYLYEYINGKQEEGEK